MPRLRLTSSDLIFFVIAAGIAAAWLITGPL
jgi:hypothetical protein